MKRALSSLMVLLLILLALPAPVAAADVIFEEPTAQATLGRPLTFRTTFRSSVEPTRVELVTRLPGEDATFVEETDVTADGDRYTATVIEEGHTTPNTTLLYRFRVTTEDGVALGPEARVTFTDARFDWRTLEGDIVRLHWYEGDEAFARRALEIGDTAVAEVSELLGVTETEPLDFFVYAEEPAFYDALGPGTRENVGGQAHAEIRTMFALIRPSDIESSWVEVVVPHELTHLVFDTAVENPYHFPPRWLNEGIAVYLSEGYKESDQALIELARGRDGLIPLEGLTGQFPTSRDAFFLAYAESVSAVDYFIRSHGQETLVALVRSYAQGLTDDEAFEAAIGMDAGEFDEAWLADLGADPPVAYGPKPAPVGPVPPDWRGDGSPGGEPSSAPEPGAPSARPSPTSGPDEGFVDDPLDPIPIVILLLLVVAGVVVLRLVADRNRSRPTPPGDGAGPP
jgi:methionine-rich copper-binding protein CopC